MDWCSSQEKYYLPSHTLCTNLLFNNELHLDPKYPLTSPKQKEFLSWQSNNIVTLTAWDLRIDYYGFKFFYKSFKSAYPKHFVSPLRITGSAVETLFSQFKYSAGGRLDAVNYRTSRAAYLVKQCQYTPFWERLPWCSIVTFIHSSQEITASDVQKRSNYKHYYLYSLCTLAVQVYMLWK